MRAAHGSTRWDRHPLKNRQYLASRKKPKKEFFYPQQFYYISVWVGPEDILEGKVS
jgi:hypothetical protein